jgi:hypothetical protein
MKMNPDSDILSVAGKIRQLATLNQPIIGMLSQLLEELVEERTYLQNCLSAITTGDMPAKADLNQTLLAMRGRTYLKWLEQSKDAGDKTVEN